MAFPKIICQALKEESIRQRLSSYVAICNVLGETPDYYLLGRIESGADEFLDLRRHRIKIVREMRSQIFRQIAKKAAGILSYVKVFLAKMTENMQADRVQRR